jgi:2-(1,2-epoxy-1,2-dihydrophenyl)acetyl-CoA isomerase
MTEHNTATNRYVDLTYEVIDGVAVVAFNRPDRANAVTTAMQSSYAAALSEADADPLVGAIVVTGNGKAFCAGADLELLQGDVAEAMGDVQESIRIVLAPLYLNKPVIAAINGGIAGMGFSLALAADVRFAAAGAKFTTAFAQRGLIAEYGSSWLLQRLVGAGRAMDLLLSARVFSAEQALGYGVVEEVFPAQELLDAAIAYARTMARTCAPTSLGIIKAQVLLGANGPLSDALALDAEIMPPSWKRPDLSEGVDSFQARRAPKFGTLDRSLIPT